MFFSLQYHVVRSQSGVRVLPRTPQHSLALAFSDVRTWTPSQWTDRLELARAAMAAGATDLIADSVRIPLQEEVSESATTLNELRGFLNRSREERSQSRDERVVQAARTSPAPVTMASRPEAPNFGSDVPEADALDLDHEDPSSPDDGLIPMPPEAQIGNTALADARSGSRSLPPADPFRGSSAPLHTAPAPVQSEQSGIASATPSPRPSRFSDAEVREGLAAGAAAAASRLLREAEDVERQIFGDVSGKPNSPLPSFAASGNRAAAELEKSARQLLEQVRNAAAGKSTVAGSPTRGAAVPAPLNPASDDAPFVRKPVTAASPPVSVTLPGRPVDTTSAAPAAAADDQPGLSFDPFLEAEVQGGP